MLDRVSETTIFISSHDLAEVETFASHVGYIDGGQLAILEQMTTLAERFREVELSFDSNPKTAEDWPKKLDAPRELGRCAPFYRDPLRCGNAAGLTYGRFFRIYAISSSPNVPSFDLPDNGKSRPGQRMKQIFHIFAKTLAGTG